MAIVMFALSGTVLEVFAVEMCVDLNLDLYNCPRSNLNMLIENLCETSYFMAMLMFALSVTILEI